MSNNPKVFDSLEGIVNFLITCKQRDGDDPFIALYDFGGEMLTEVNAGYLNFIDEGEELDTLRKWLLQALKEAYAMGEKTVSSEVYSATRRDILFLVLDAVISNDAALSHAVATSDNPVQDAIDLLCKHNVKTFAEGKAEAKEEMVHSLRREIELQKASLRDAELARHRTEEHLRFLEATERYMQGLAGIEEGT